MSYDKCRELENQAIYMPLENTKDRNLLSHLAEPCMAIAGHVALSKEVERERSSSSDVLGFRTALWLDRRCTD